MNDGELREHKLELAEANVKLGRHRLYVAIGQALLTVMNLGVSVTILFHLLGGKL